jgi:hypothetical protein
MNQMNVEAVLREANLERIARNSTIAPERRSKHSCRISWPLRCGDVQTGPDVATPPIWRDGLNAHYSSRLTRHVKTRRGVLFCRQGHRSASRQSQHPFSTPPKSRFATLVARSVTWSTRFV